MTSKVPDLSDEWDAKKLRNWMANARRMERNDVYQAAFRQLCRIEGRDHDDPLAAEFAAVMRALEEALSEQNGKTTRLSRTRQKLQRAGVRKTLADLALKPKPSEGFLKLMEFGMGDMAAEALIVKYRSEFEPEVVAAAERRLAEYGIG